MMNKFSNIYKIIVFIIFMALISYMIIIYIKQKDEYEQKLLDKTNQIVELGTPPRGRIFDRNGIVLVDNIAIKNIVFKYQKGINTKEVAQKLAKYIFNDNLLDNDLITYYEAFRIDLINGIKSYNDSQDYISMYKKEEKESTVSNPKTGVYKFMGGLSLVGIVAVCVYFNMRHKTNFPQI